MIRDEMREDSQSSENHARKHCFLAVWLFVFDEFQQTPT